jgi:hypothetical protein
MGAQKCEMDLQRTKSSQLETKLEEQTQKHNKETCIILGVVNKQNREIQSLQENHKIQQQWM